MIDIARDYHHTGMTTKEIALKHKIAPSKIPYIVSKFKKEDLPKEKRMAVIKVEDKWVNHIVELLERRGIEVEVPGDYELLEFFKSKI